MLSEKAISILLGDVMPADVEQGSDALELLVGSRIRHINSANIIVQMLDTVRL